MDIESLDNGKARVRFDSHDERWSFGASVMYDSVEGLRCMNYMLHGVVVRPYSHKPEDYPQYVDMRNSTLGKALGRLSTSMDLPNEDLAVANQHMTKAIAEYFSELVAVPEASAALTA
jgi:hypothetical protein